jgi:hypothetical protein
MFDDRKFAKALIAKFLIAIAIGLSGAAAAEAQAPNKPGADRQTLIERHKQAAEMHDKMAICLASTKTVDQCRDEMIAACDASFGGKCPMVRKGGRGGQGRGMMGQGWMFDDDAGDDKDDKKSP